MGLVLEESNLPPGSAVLALVSPPSGGRRRRWRLVLFVVSALVLTAAVFLATLAGTYQPLRFGGEWGGSFPGLPSGVGIRTVNTFGIATGDLYVPPQPGPFAIVESIQNSGSYGVTIEALSVQSPSADYPAWPLAIAGPVLYRPEGGPLWSKGQPLLGLSLRPGQAIQVAIPLRQQGACYTQGWVGTSFFYVEEKFLTFEHWVKIPLGAPLVMHQPEPPGSGIAQLVCPGLTTTRAPGVTDT